ncbi:hypothetical protein [Fulvivirga sp. M361]|uniref:hypothetical protein n=1 Tax=Fulvivirga sp. M361 TaxID=2594266 RepID=UPI001628D675|nr:hypothetical protein [Fulvivirga sp. M361]
MVTVIKKGTDKEIIDKLLKEALKTKGVDTHKYCGVIKLKEDPLVIQKRLRDEWE